MMFTKNKKAQHTTDMVDFILTVFVSFFFLMFVGFLLNSGINDAEERTLENVEDFKRINSAMYSLRMHSTIGSNVDFNNLDSLIQKSKMVGGKIVVSCEDYIDGTHCVKDVVELYPVNQNKCKWIAERCQTK